MTYDKELLNKTSTLSNSWKVKSSKKYRLSCTKIGNRRDGGVYTSFHLVYIPGVNCLEMRPTEKYDVAGWREGHSAFIKIQDKITAYFSIPGRFFDAVKRGETWETFPSIETRKFPDLADVVLSDSLLSEAFEQGFVEIEDPDNKTSAAYNLDLIFSEKK